MQTVQWDYSGEWDTTKNCKNCNEYICSVFNEPFKNFSVTSTSNGSLIEWLTNADFLLWKWIVYVKNYPNPRIFLHWRISITAHVFCSCHFWSTLLLKSCQFLIVWFRTYVNLTKTFFYEKWQALYVIRTKYWKADGSGNPPSLILALLNIGIIS